MTNKKSGLSTVILVTGDGMGKADAALGQKLFGIFLRLLGENGMLPAAICFYTEGVKLVANGSPVIEPLRALEAKGVALISCSTCLNYFGLMDQVAVGIIGGMPDILEALWRAEKVITI